MYGSVVELPDEYIMQEMMMAITNSSRREKHSYIQTLQISKVIEACWKFAGFDKDVKGSYDGSGRKPAITCRRQ
jgi:hypothetical protein